MTTYALVATRAECFFIFTFAVVSTSQYDYAYFVIFTSYCESVD